MTFLKPLFKNLQDIYTFAATTSKERTYADYSKDIAKDILAC